MQTARDYLKQMCDALPVEVVEELIEVCHALQHQAAADRVEEAMDEEEQRIVASALADPFPCTYAVKEAKTYLGAVSRRG